MEEEEEKDKKEEEKKEGEEQKKEEQKKLGEDIYVKWFSDIGKQDVKDVGGKAANLGEMLSLELPVPQGFAVTSEAYSYFLEKTGLKEKIYEMLGKIDVENTSELEKTAKEIREMIIEQEMPSDLKEEILEAYEILSFDKEQVKNASKNVLSILKMADPSFVAIRSSATAEDTEKASFAGQQETFLNVKGKEKVIQAVKKCFASLFTARSIYYRVKKKIKHKEVLNAVIVQLMINSDKSGVIFSRNPVTGEDNIVIEAVFGLGEGIVSGKINPDKYIISKELEIIDTKVANKKKALTRNSAGETEEVKLIEERSNQQVLSNYEIKKLANFAIKLEKHYNIPQDIEFSIDTKEIYIVQTRPVTTLGKEIKREEEIEAEEILSGLAASPGIGSGEVKIIKNLSELSKIKKGDVLVTEMTNPDMVVTMQKCSAIVTNEGGVTAHAAIVSREMGIPAVVGTEKATEVLKDDMIVTVDGFKGKIYEGKVEELKAKKVEILPIVKTETKIKVMVDLPNFAERASKSECKEVGLVRLEGIIAESGKHPYGFLKNNEVDKYEELIFSGLKKISQYFDELWVRTSDIRSDEYMNLEGAPKEKEVNPMLGMHGIRDSLKHKEILKAELKAISKIEKRKGVLLPQVISVDEVRKVKELLKEMEIELKVGVMVETPASVQIIEELCDGGISFISFGTNDLTQYTLAVDRGDEDVQELFDEMNPAILSQLRRVIEVCKSKGVETSICGQAGSKKEMVEFLIKLGIDSISVNADKAKEISEFVKELEDKGLRGSELEEVKREVEVEEEVKEEKIEEKGEEVKKEEKSQRKTYPIICDECGKEAEVPFKPKEGRSVYCRECYRKKKNKTADNEKEKVKEKPEEKLGERKEAEEEKPKEEVKEEKPEEKPAEGVKEEKQEGFGDTDFGFDVFSNQEQPVEEKKAEEEKLEEKPVEVKEKEKIEVKGGVKEEKKEVGIKEEESEEEEIEEEIRELERIEEEKNKKEQEDSLDIF